jgi:hypothetical protein
MKTYRVRSSAHRAAKQAGLSKDRYQIVEDADGFSYRPLKTEAPIGTELEGAPQNYCCPHCKIDLENGVGLHNQEVNGKPIKHDRYLYACLACAGEFGPSIPKQKVKKAAGKGNKRANRSTVEGPTKLVWHIAEEMVSKNPEAKRKDIIAECENRGVTFYTARTQYQQWLTAVNNSK